jgi:peptide chain release factor 1
MSNQSVTEVLSQQISQLENRLTETKQLLESDPALKELAHQEIEQIELEKQALLDSIAQIQSDSSTSTNSADPSDPDTAFDHFPAIMEIRGGAGGEEAKIFADDLLKMYIKYAQIKKFKVVQMDDGIVKISGKQAYGTFKYEAGVHRVQRVPETESSGRIHTSTASIAVLPEIPASYSTIREEDLVWKFTRAGGHGGQNVNKVNTAVLLTHTPTGIVVSCRQERSQQQNRDIALEILRARIWEAEEEKRLAKITQKRRIAVGTAARSEKIRTYNFPQSRVTDHRIKESWHNLEEILEGSLDPIITALKTSLTNLDSVEGPSTND